jgi:hypothetical protein
MAGNPNQIREETPALELGRALLPVVAEWNPRRIRAASQWLHQPSFKAMTRNIVRPPIKTKQKDQNNNERNQDSDSNWIDSGLASRCGRYPLFREVFAARVSHLATVFLTMHPQASGEVGSFAKGTFNEDRCKFLGGYWASLFQLLPMIDHVVSRFNAFGEQFLAHSTFPDHTKDYAPQNFTCQDSKVCQYDQYFPGNREAKRKSPPRPEPGGPGGRGRCYELIL